jgi:flagellar biosynthesis GTPase FlhF
MEEMLVKQSEKMNWSQNARETTQGLRKQLGVERSYLANVSPFLVFFWGANLALLGIICFTPLGNWRLLFTLPLCAVLLGVLVIHVSLGLPLERRLGQVVVEAMREDPSEAILLLAAFKNGKTVWYWLTLASAALLALTEPLLNWLRAERWSNWLVPCGITGGAAMLMLGGVVVQFALRELIVSDIENRIALLGKTEEEKRRKAEAEQRRFEAERLVEARTREAEAERARQEAERLRQQAALKAEETRLLEQRRQQEREEQQRRDLLEQQRRARMEAEEQAALEAARRKVEVEREAARKADLEKKGLPYYPRPLTPYNDRTAEEWSRLAQAHLTNYRVQMQAAEALVALKEEGTPFLLEFLQKQTTPAGLDAVLRRIQPEYIHPNDLSKLLPCLEKRKALPDTRMLALRYLHKHAEYLKDLLPKIETRVRDLQVSNKYRTEINDILEDVREKTK